MEEVVVSDDNITGKRLDIALAISLDNYTRNYIKKQIESNKVSVNGLVEYRGNYKIKKGDRICIEIDPVEEGNHDHIEPENIPIEIVYEDDDLIVINKPRGMVVHPASGNWTGTVMNALVYHYRNLSNVGKAIRSGLIHRLDKDTSGLLLIGKTNRGLWHYSNMFAKRMVQKTYIACVSGRLPVDFKASRRCVIQNYLARNNLNRKKMKVVGGLGSSYGNKEGFASGSGVMPADSRLAVTEFELMGSSGNKHIYFASPKTGRTHQIRVHCSYIGTPVIGDKVYGGIRNDIMMLHAYTIEIINPDGKLLYLKAVPDSVFVNYIDRYKLDKSFL